MLTRKIPFTYGDIINFFVAVGTLALAFFAFLTLHDTNETGKRQLRAYVYVTPEDVFHADGKGGALQVYTLVGNSGQTFATNVKIYLGFDVLPPTSKKISDLNETTPEEGVIVIAPNSPSERLPIIRNWKGGQPTIDQFQKILRGDLRIYVFGSIIYEDAFGDRHFTDFCHSYYGSETANNYVSGQLPNQTVSKGYKGWQAKYCEVGNEVGDLSNSRQWRHHKY